MPPKRHPQLSDRSQQVTVAAETVGRVIGAGGKTIERLSETVGPGFSALLGGLASPSSLSTTCPSASRATRRACWPGRR